MQIVVSCLLRLNAKKLTPATHKINDSVLTKVSSSNVVQYCH